MSALAASLRTDLRRYAGSRGIWLLMLAAPIAARFWVPRDDGSAMAIAIDGHLPEPGSAVIGLALGAACGTVFLPIAWGYLRTNITRLQPWQVVDVTPASRVAISVGRFGADAAIMVGLLVALTIAGCMLALVTLGSVQPLSLAAPLWLIALPPLLCVAGLHRLCAGRSLLRRAPGDLLFVVLWMMMLVAPFTGSANDPGLAGALSDGAGIVRPLSGDAERHPALAIGIIPVRAGHVPVDVASGIRSDGYVVSRLAWAAIGIALAALAGLCYRSPRRTARSRPHKPVSAAVATPGPAQPAPRSRSPRLTLLMAEMAALLGGPRSRWLTLAAAAIGCIGDYRHVGSPTALLLLVFGLAAHAGRWASKGLAPLSVTLPVSSVARGTATVVAAASWGLLLALPAAVLRFNAAALGLGLVTAGLAGVIATIAAAATRSAAVPRLVLLLLWYGYYSA